MIKEIMKDEFFLKQKANDANINDIKIGEDLRDTLLYHYKERQDCIGMSANMIGVNKKVIAIVDEGKIVVMYNPKLLKGSGGTYKIEEYCLSRENKDPIETTRYNKVKIEYFDEKFKKKIKTFNGLTAENIQHQLDHLQGILI